MHAVRVLFLVSGQQFYAQAVQFSLVKLNQKQKQRKAHEMRRNLPAGVCPIEPVWVAVVAAAVAAYRNRAYHPVDKPSTAEEVPE